MTRKLVNAPHGCLDRIAPCGVQSWVALSVC